MKLTFDELNTICSIIERTITENAIRAANMRMELETIEDTGEKAFYWGIIDGTMSENTELKKLRLKVMGMMKNTSIL